MFELPIKLEAQKVFITGGNGWLGRAVVHALRHGDVSYTGVQVGGDLSICCLVPDGENIDDLKQNGVEVVRGDVRDAAAREKLLGAADGGVLIHLAGIIHPKRVADFEAINTQGTIDLVADAKRKGVRRAVVMSSNSPIGCNPTTDHVFTEESPYHPYMGYGRSKWLMELALRSCIASGQSPEITIIRAPWFYGPYQPPRQTLFFRMVRDGKFPIVGDGTNRRSMGYTENLAQGILLASAHSKAAGEIFWLADEVPYSMNEIVETTKAVLAEDFGMKVSAKQLKVPGVISDVAQCVDWGLQSVGVYHQKIHVLSEMNKTIACSVEKAKAILGYQPRIALREGMRRSVDWCLKNGQNL